MGKMKETPRYNVLSFRATDDEIAQIRAAIGKRTRQEFILAAVLEMIAKEDEIEYRRRVDYPVGEEMPGVCGPGQEDHAGEAAALA